MMKARWWTNLLSFDRLVIAIVFIAAFTILVRMPLDTDMFWHLRSGKWIFENRQFYFSDPFSHTRVAAPWIYVGWLGQLVLYVVYCLGSWAGLSILAALTLLIPWVLVWKLRRTPKRTTDHVNLWVSSLVVVLGAACTNIIAAPRPQIFSFLLVGVFFYLLERYRTGNQKAIWWLPILMLAWVNLHGGFVTGFILIGAYILGGWLQVLWDQRPPNPYYYRNLFIVLLLCIVVVPINPYGFRAYRYPVDTVNLKVLRVYIAEWQQPNFLAPNVLPFTLMSLALLVVIGLANKPTAITDLIRISVFGMMAVITIRNVPLFAVIASTTLIDQSCQVLRSRLKLERQHLPWRGASTLANTAVLILVTIAASLWLTKALSRENLDKERKARLPVDAAAWIKDNQPAGPIFNNYNWGGYLIWELPEYPVFTDGRTDLYGDEFLIGYAGIITGSSNWHEVLDRWNVKLIVVKPDDILAIEMQETDSGWSMAYVDETAVVFIKE